MGYDQLKNMIDYNRTQKSVEEKALENNECPYDIWDLDINSRGEKSCPMCGRVWVGTYQILKRGK